MFICSTVLRCAGTLKPGYKLQYGLVMVDITITVILCYKPIHSLRLTNEKSFHLFDKPVLCYTSYTCFTNEQTKFSFIAVGFVFVF